MSKNNIYLIAKYIARPKDPKKTSTAGYVTNMDNVQYDEQVYIARGMRTKYLQNHVVMDLTEEKIIKNSFKSGTKFKELFAHFYEGYADYINDCVTTLNEDLQVK